MRKTFYEKLSIELPDSLEEMSDDEKKQYYPMLLLDFAWIDRGSKSIFGLKRQGNVQLEKIDVKSRIVAYEEYYHRMCPGYQRGEILMRRETLFNLGILSYKSNTPDSMRFSILGVMNFMDTEVLISMSCDVGKAIDEMPKFTAILQSIDVNK